MINTINKLAEYLHKVLDIDVSPQKWIGVGSLPFYLAEIYDFFIIEVLNNPVIIMNQKSHEVQTPAAIRKHYEAVIKNRKEAVLYLCNTITPFNRKRLVEHKVPFAVPGSQLYLPDLGIDLREHFRQVRSSRETFSPSTQILILFSILNKNHGPFTPAGIANILHYTPMTISRVFDELETAGIGLVQMSGRERLLTLPADPRELWLTTSSYLKSPVRKTLFVRPGNISGFHDIPMAGFSALSMHSMLAGPGFEIRAVGPESWNYLKLLKGFEIMPVMENNTIELQIWRYSPGLLSSINSVDILSLYLSLRDEKDERVQKALEEMMENYNW